MQAVGGQNLNDKTQVQVIARAAAILHALDQRDDLKLFAGVASHEPDYRPFAGRVATPRGGPPGREIGPGAAETPGGPRAHQRGP